MTRPLVTVVVETITARYDGGDTTGSLADDLDGTITALGQQTWPQDRIEVIVVLDDAIDPATAEELRARYRDVRFVQSTASNYFVAKNAGAAAARGDVIALLDGDCVPDPDWLDVLLARFDDDVDVVVGCTRYTGQSFAARTFSIPDFAYVLDKADGDASGFNINNVAFRAGLLQAHPFDARIRRNGGCFLLYHQLRAAGARIVYEPRARVSHGLDIRGLGFMKKHFDRGYDGLGVYRLDDRGLLRGTRWIRRSGGLAIVPIMARRIVVDWLRLAKHRRQIGISIPALPWYGAVAAATRLIELAGALKAIVVR